jgi:hypothetical protein
LNAHNALPVSSRDLGLWRQCFDPKEKTAQHGVKALDGGDADAADAVELRGLINSFPRFDPSGFPSMSHCFPLAPLQMVRVDILTSELARCETAQIRDELHLGVGAPGLTGSFNYVAHQRGHDLVLHSNIALKLNQTLSNLLKSRFFCLFLNGFCHEFFQSRHRA